MTPHSSLQSHLCFHGILFEPSVCPRQSSRRSFALESTLRCRRTLVWHCGGKPEHKGALLSTYLLASVLDKKDSEQIVMPQNSFLFLLVSIVNFFSGSYFGLIFLYFFSFLSFIPSYFHSLFLH